MASLAAFGKENIFSDDEESIHWDHSMSRDINNSLDLSIEFPTDVSLFAKHQATTSSVLPGQHGSSGAVQRPVFSTPPARYSRHPEQRMAGKEHYTWTERAKMGKALLNWGVLEVDGDRPRRPFGRVNTQGGSLTPSPAVSSEFIKPNFARSLQFERGEAEGALAPSPAMCHSMSAAVHASPRRAALTPLGASDSPRSLESRKRITSLEAQQAALLARNAALLEEMEDVEIRSVVAVMVAKAICAVERSCARAAQEEHAAATEGKAGPGLEATAMAPLATSASSAGSNKPSSSPVRAAFTTSASAAAHPASPHAAASDLASSHAAKAPVGLSAPRPRTTEKKPKAQGVVTPGSPCGPFSPLPKKRRHSVVFGAVSARGRMTFNTAVGGAASASIARRACQCGLSGGVVDATAKSFLENGDGVAALPANASGDAGVGPSSARKRGQSDGQLSINESLAIAISTDTNTTVTSKSSTHHHSTHHHHPSSSHHSMGGSTRSDVSINASMAVPQAVVVKSSASSVGFLVPPVAARKAASAEKKLKEAEKRLAAAKAAAAKREAELTLRAGSALHERDAARGKIKALEDELATLKVKASDLTGALEFAQQQLEQHELQQQLEQQASCDIASHEGGISTPGPAPAVAKATPTALSRMEATRLQYEAARTRNQELEAILSAMAHRHAAETEELKELLAEAYRDQQERDHCRSLGLPTREQAVHALVTDILYRVTLSAKDNEVAMARAERDAVQAARDADAATSLASATSLQARIDALQEELKSREATIAELRRTSSIMLGTIASGVSINGSMARNSLGGMARNSLGGDAPRNSLGGARLSLMLTTPRSSLVPTPRSSYGGGSVAGHSSIGEEVVMGRSSIGEEDEVWPGGELTLGDSASAVVESLESSMVGGIRSHATGTSDTAAATRGDETVDLGVGVDGEDGDGDTVALPELGSLLDLGEVSLVMPGGALGTAGAGLGIGGPEGALGLGEVSLELPPLQLEKLHDELGRLSTLVVTLEGDKRAAEAEAERVMMRLESAEEGRRATQAAADTLAEDLRRSHVDLERLRTLLEGAESARSAAESRAEEAEASVSSLRGDMRRVEGEAEKVMWALAQAQAEREHAAELASQVALLEEQLSTARAEYAQSAHEAGAQVEALQASEACVRAELAAATEALQVATAATEEKVSTLRACIAKLEADKSEQSQLLASAHASQRELAAQRAAADVAASGSLADLEASRIALDAATAKINELEAAIARTGQLEAENAARLAELEADKAARVAELDVAAAKLAELEAENLAASTELERMQVEVGRAVAEREAADRAAADATSRLREREADEDKAAVRRESLRAEWEARCAQLEEDVVALRYQLGKGEEEQQALARQVDESKREAESLRRQVEALEQEGACLRCQAEALEKENSGLRCLLDGVKVEAEELRGALEAKGQEVVALKQALAEQEGDGRKVAEELGDKVAVAERELAASRELLACAGEELKALQEGRELAAQDLAHERQRSAAASSRASDLEETLELLREERGRLAVEASRSSDAAAQSAVGQKHAEARGAALASQLGDARSEVARMSAELAALREAAEAHAREIMLARGELDAMARYVEDIVASKGVAEASAARLANEVADAREQLSAAQDDAVNLRLMLAEATASRHAMAKEAAGLREMLAGAHAGAEEASRVTAAESVVAAEELARLRGLLASTEEEVAAVRSRLVEVECARRDSAERGTEALATVIEEDHKELSFVMDKLATVTAERYLALESLAVAQGRLDEAEQELVGVKGELAGAREMLAAATAERHASQAAVERVQAEVLEAREAADAVSEKLRGTNLRLTAAVANAEEARCALASVMVEQGSAKAELAQAVEELANAKRALGEVEDVLVQTKAALASVTADRDAKQEELASSMEALVTANWEGERAREALVAVTEQLAGITAHHQDAMEKLASVTTAEEVARKVEEDVVASAAKRVASLTAELEEKRACLVSFAELLAAVTADLQGHDTALALMTERISSLSGELEDKQACLASATDQVASLTGQLASKASEMGLKEASLAFLSEQLASVTSVWQAATEQLGSANARVGALEAELEGERDVRQDVAAQVELLGEYGSALEARHAALQARCMELEAKCAALERDKVEMHAGMELLRDAAKHEEYNAGLRLEELGNVVFSLQSRLAGAEAEAQASADQLSSARHDLGAARVERDELLATVARQQAQAAASEAERRAMAMSPSVLSSAVTSPQFCARSPSMLSLKGDGDDVAGRASRSSSLDLASLAFAGAECVPGGEGASCEEQQESGQGDGDVHTVCRDALCAAACSHLVRMAVATVVMRAEAEAARAQADAAVARAERHCKRRAEECEALRLEVKAAKQSYVELSEFCELEQSIAAERGSETDAVIAQLRAELEQAKAELQRAQEALTADTARSAPATEALIAEALLAAEARHAAALESLRAEHEQASADHADALQDSAACTAKLEAELADASNKYSVASAKLAEVSADHAALVTKHGELMTELEEAKSALASVTGQLASATEQLICATGRAEGLEEERVRLEGDRDRLMAALETVTVSKSALVEKLVVTDGAVGRLKEEAAALKRDRQRAVDAATEQLAMEVKSLEVSLSEARARTKKALAERDSVVAMLEEETEGRDAALRSVRHELGGQLAAAHQAAEVLRAELVKKGEEYEGLMLKAREAEASMGEHEAMKKDYEEAKQMAAKMQRHIVELRNAHGSALAEIQRLTDKLKLGSERQQILISNLQKAESEVEAIDKEKEALQRLLRMLQHGLRRHAHFIAPCAELVNMVKAVNEGLKAVEAAEDAHRA